MKNNLILCAIALNIFGVANVWAAAGSTTLGDLQLGHRQGITGWCPGTDNDVALTAAYKQFLISEGLGFVEFGNPGLSPCIMTACPEVNSIVLGDEAQFENRFELGAHRGHACFRDK